MVRGRPLQNLLQGREMENFEQLNPIIEAPPAEAVASRAPEPQIAKRDLVEGLIKGIEVITAFNEDYPRMTTTEVARRTGLSRSAARRYLLTLVHLGLVSHDRSSFWLTPRIMRLGQSYLDSSRIPRAVTPFLERLTMQLQESTNFAVLDGSELVYLTRVNAPRLTTAGIMPGTRMPAFATAGGRVLLAALPDDKLRAMLAAEPLVAYTHLTTTGVEDLLREIDQIRKRGYSVCENQYEMGIGEISVLVKNRNGAILGALNVSMNVGKGDITDYAPRYIPALQATASTLMKWI